MDTTKLLVIGVAVVVVAAAAGVVVYNSINNDKKSSELVDLEGWSDVLDDAKGQTVNLGFYITQDVAINQSFWPYMQQEMKNKYGITVTAGEKYGPGAATAAATEIQNGETNGTYDLIWGNTSAYNAMIVNGTHYDYVYQKANADGKQWGQILPNSYYLKDNSERVIADQFKDFKSGTAVEFSNGQTMFIYNADFNRKVVTFGDETAAVPYDCVLVFDGKNIKGVVKVASDEEGASGFAAGNVSTLSAQSKSAFESAWGACSTAYKIGEVRSVLADGGVAKGKIAYGLPSTYGELFNWIKIYKHQFSYPDYNNAYANFHTDLIVQAIAYELTWDGNSGWKVAENKADNIKAVNEALKDVKTADDFKNKFGYVFNYLNAIEPYLNAVGYIELPNAIGAINGKIVGNAAENDYSDATVMIAMTTCTSIDSRVTPGSGHDVVTQYSYNAAVFTMDTGCYSDYYMFIPANSQHVSAAMVVANWLLDPEVQFKWFTQTGNGLSIDVEKEMYGATGKGLGYTVKEYYEAPDHRLSEYTLTLSPDRLAEVTVNSDFTPYLTTSIAAWTSYVKESSDPIVKP